MSSHLTEFGPEFRPVPEWVHQGVDGSCRNDVCPSWALWPGGPILRVDAVRLVDRECGGPRFRFAFGPDTVLTTESEQEAESAWHFLRHPYTVPVVNTLLTGDRDALRRLYRDTIGYDPHEDSPDLPTGEIRQTLREYFVEFQLPARNLR